MDRIAATLLIALGLISSASAQNAQRLAFQVASVRPAAPGQTQMSQKITPGRLDFTHTPLVTVLMDAFGIQTFQLAAPSWVNTARFDIHATYPAGATRSDVRAMLQTLLVDRFGLVTHVEPRRVEAFELVVLPGGHRMREVEAVDELTKEFPRDPSLLGSNLDATHETPDGPTRTMMIPFGGRTITSRSHYSFWTTPQRTFMVDATRMTMSEFAGLLWVNLRRPVIDRTGLAGLYQFKAELEVTPNPIAVARNADAPGNRELDAPTGASTTRALETLGLKLEERRAPIDVLVVDKIERTPTDN